MKNNALNILIIVILALGTYFILQVSYLHYTEELKCTSFLIVPACYLGSIYFIFLLIFHIVKKQEVLFFIFLGAGLALSIYASIENFRGVITCVSSSLDFPLCYVVLVLFIIVMVLKFVFLNNSKNLVDNDSE